MEEDKKIPAEETTVEETKVETTEQPAEETIKEETTKDIKEASQFPEFSVGDIIKVWTRITELGQKEKVQPFEGQVLAIKHGKEQGASFLIRKVVDGVGVERIIPFNSPLIKKIEIIERLKARRSKLYYLREAKGRRAKLKKIK